MHCTGGQAARGAQRTRSRRSGGRGSLRTCAALRSPLCRRCLLALPAMSARANSSPALSSTAGSAAAAAAPSPAAAASASSATLQVFWDLAKEDAADRAAACQVLLQSLSNEQTKYIASGGDKKAEVAAIAKAKLKAEEGEEEDAAGDDEHEADSPLTNTALPTNLCPSLAYALKRLTRGLASSRAGARQGFALALTEILTNFSVVRTEDVLNIVADQIKLSSKANKQVTNRTHSPTHRIDTHTRTALFPSFLHSSNHPGFIVLGGEY